VFVWPARRSLLPYDRQCVAHAVMDACDLGYLVTLLPEATATYSQARQVGAHACACAWVCSG
jgi:nicotinamidase-related amidase